MQGDEFHCLSSDHNNGLLTSWLCLTLLHGSLSIKWAPPTKEKRPSQQWLCMNIYTPIWLCHPWPWLLWIAWWWHTGLWSPSIHSLGIVDKVVRCWPKETGGKLAPIYNVPLQDGDVGEGGVKCLQLPQWWRDYSRRLPYNAQLESCTVCPSWRTGRAGTNRILIIFEATAPQGFYNSIIQGT